MLWQNFFLQTLALVLLVSSSLSNPYCPICGWGKMVTNEEADVFIPTYGTYSCGLLEERSHEGYVPQENCFALQMFSRRKCGCEPAPFPSNAPTFSTSPTLSVQPSVTPTDNPTISTAPTAELSSHPSATPTFSTTATLSARSYPLQYEVLEGLSMQLIGITALRGRSIQEWVRATQTYTSNFFSITNPSIHDFETKISVTGFVAVPAERRNLRQMQHVSSVKIFYKQEFKCRTTNDLDAAYLATMPFSEAVNRGSYSILLQDLTSLTGLQGVSTVEVPAVPGVRG